MDKAEKHPLSETRKAAEEIVEVMIPIVKAYSTEIGLENVSLALQVHGGMGFIEETGAAQHYRDQRITPIYEGTTGIQAMDLLGRKLLRDGGQMTRRVIAYIRQDSSSFSTLNSTMRQSLDAGLDALDAAVDQLLVNAGSDIRAPAAVSEPYLRLWGVVACGWQMAKAAHKSKLHLEGGSDDPFFLGKIRTAEFYFASEMPKINYLAQMIRDSGTLISNAGTEFFAVA